MSEEIKFMDLESIGVTYKRGLHKILSECFQNQTEEQFEKTIHTFQSENSLLLPSLQPMLPLLYLLEVPRLKFHESVMEELRNKLIHRIEEIAKNEPPKSRDEKLKTLLEKAFPFIKNPMLQPVVMALLNNLEVIDDKYLQALVREDLYKLCHTRVKRHIWQEKQSLLIEELSPLLSQYIEEKEQIFTNIKEPRQVFFSLSSKQRRQNKVLENLVDMVGKNVVLYDTIGVFIRTVFLHTGNGHYCTLKVSLLMELHDASVTDITSMDACHKFAWCLDACIRESTIDDKRTRELQGFLDSIKKGEKENMMGDLSMILADPYAIHFLASTIMRDLNSLIQKEVLPREGNNSQLQFLLRLLNLGLHAQMIMEKQQKNPKIIEPKLNPELLTKFLPVIMGFMIDDQVRALDAKLPLDDRESALTIIEHSGPPPDIFNQFVLEDPIAAVIAIYYLAQAATKYHDRQAVCRVLGSLTPNSTYGNLSYTDPFQYIIVCALISLGEEFKDDALCTLVFDEYFLVNTFHRSNIPLYLMKILYHVHQWVPEKHLEKQLALLQQHCQTMESKELQRESLKELREKIHQDKLKKQEQQEKLQTPPLPGSVSVRIPPATPSHQQYMPMMTPMHSSYGGPMSPLPSQSPFHMPSTSRGYSQSSSSAANQSSYEQTY